MSVVVVGLNHRSVPLDLLERMTIDDSRLPKALHDVSCREHVSEAVVLSTCNRTEIYVVAEKFHGAYADLRNFLSEMAYLPPEDFADHLYVQHDDEAVAHLFAVTAGLESAVVGEAEILGQVRQAWERAQEEGTAGSSLNLLFRHALEVGKRARTETGIARHIASVSTAAVAMAAERLGSLDGRRILVLGAGEMGEGMVRALATGGVDDVRIANRTWERAVELADGLVADGLAGRAVRLADLNESLAEVDLLLTSTGATSIMLEHGDLSRVMKARAGRPLLIVDVAVPRDVDPSAADLDGRHAARHGRPAGLRRCRHGRAPARGRPRCSACSTTSSSASCRSSTAREVAPLVAGLHDRGESIRSAELDRFRSRLGELDAKQVDAVEALTKGIVAKLLHDPTIGLKDAAGTPRASGWPRPSATCSTFDPRRRIRAATRGSALARWQTDHVAALLRAADPSVEVEVVVVETLGDRRQDIPIWEMGGKGVFAKEVQAAVLDGRADIAVHSAKDLPSGSPPGLTHRHGARAGRRPRRAGRLDARRAGARAPRWPPARSVVGRSWRGPGPTSPSPSCGATSTPAWPRPPASAPSSWPLAPLERLGLLDARRRGARPRGDAAAGRPGHAGGRVPRRRRPRDVDLRALLAAIEHGPSRTSLDAERGFLAELGGDCDLPAGAHAVVTGTGVGATVQVEGMLASLDGHTVVRHALEGPSAEADQLGRAVARYLLDDAGGSALLDR